MFKANEIYKRNLESLVASGYNTIGQKVRPKYKDGRPSHTKFINNVCDTYDLAKTAIVAGYTRHGKLLYDIVPAGEFPISNYRPIAWKSAIKEMLWIYQDFIFKHFYCLPSVNILVKLLVMKVSNRSEVPISTISNPQILMLVHLLFLYLAVNTYSSLSA